MTKNELIGLIYSVDPDAKAELIADAIRTALESLGVEDAETVPIDFVMWYSGMDKIKVMRAFTKWEEEKPEPCDHINTKNHSENSFYCSNCNQIIEF